MAKNSTTEFVFENCHVLGGDEGAMTVAEELTIIGETWGFLLCDSSPEALQYYWHARISLPPSQGYGFADIMSEAIEAAEAEELTGEALAQAQAYERRRVEMLAREVNGGQ